MTLSGPEALRSLDEALRDIRREEDEIAKRLAHSAELMTKLREQEGELLRQLAQVRLDPATQSELAGQISQAELKARDMLKTHGADLAASNQRLAALDADISKDTAERATLQADAARRDSELKALADKVRPQLSTDPAFAKKLADARELAAIAEESLRKTNQAEADRDEKGKPYRDDPLFMYLWNAGYGTKNYRANNFVAWLDGKVAALVGYPEARPNFSMLNEIPLRLREHAERQQANAQAADDELVALESAAIDAAGGKAAREAMEDVVARIDALDKDIVSLQDQRDEALKAQRELAQGSDPAFAAAIAGLAEALGREDLRNLLAAARATQTGQDDTIVKQIDDLRQRRKEEDDEATDQKSRLKTLAARRRELEDIQYEFKKQGFDNPSSTFREDNLVGDLLNDFLRGGISAANYWNQWQRSQKWTGPRTDNWNFDERFGGDNRRDDSDDNGWGNFNWPDNSFGGGGGGGSSKRSKGYGGPGGGWGRITFGNSGGGSGGTFSRPRTGSSGSRSGGGFKTGGGF
ncbi:MAG: hypothetical protein EOP22_11520 [Hyphomicrobiales bacterium]|nr:MAG: hypothetical protein EOP22_11520 [Hyphomicrobiales bacterium]